MPGGGLPSRRARCNVDSASRLYLLFLDISIWIYRLSINGNRAHPMKSSIAAALVFSALVTGALAQTPQPYAGMQVRPVKALSDQQVADLKAGRGMGLAL